MVNGAAARDHSVAARAAFVAGGFMRAIRRILVAIKDMEARSLPIVAKAAHLARALGAEMELFHAIDAPLYADVTSSGRQGLRELASYWQRQFVQQLDRAAARVAGKDLSISTAVEWDYPGYEAIVRRARRIGADLIVAERHGGRHIAPWLLHMTDWELLRLSPVPVLIAKSPRPYRRPVVLAAVDPSHAFAKPGRLDDQILQLAGTFTKAVGGTLHAVHACPPPLPIGTPPRSWTTGKMTAKDIQAELEAKAVARARPGFDRVLESADIPRSRRHLVPRHPIDAIPQVARETRCAIAVMGAVSRSGLKSLFIGNTAERVLDALPCDLLVVKPLRFETRVPRAVRGVRIAAAAPPP
jgi:universal stress protein E